MLTQPFQPSRALYRVGKYLLPQESLYWQTYGYPAPQQVASLPELQQRFPECVTVRCGQMEPTLEPSTFDIVSAGAVTTGQLPELAGQQNRVHVIQGGASVGRNCCLLGPEDTIVSETGFYLDSAVLARSLTLGRLHPHFWRYRWQGDLRSRWTLPKRQYIEGAIAPINNRCSHNFFHWLTEVAPRITAIEMVGLRPDWYLVDCQSRFQQQVLEMLGVPLSKVIQPHCALHLAADELHYVKDVSREVLCRFAAAIKDRLQLPTRSSGKKIYISRRKARHRKVANERQIEDHLRTLGFEVLCFEDLMCKDQFRAISEAQIVLTTHGAALANCIFAAPQTDIIELFPNRRLNVDLYPTLSRNCGLRHHTVLIESSKYLQRIRVDMPDLTVSLGLCNAAPTSARRRAA